MADFTEFTAGIDPLEDFGKTDKPKEIKTAPTAKHTKPSSKGGASLVPFEDYLRAGRKVPAEELPSYKDDIAAGMQNAVMGITNTTLHSLPAIAAKYGVKAIPGVGEADMGMALTGAIEPLIRRAFGDTAGDVAKKAGEYSPSNQVSSWIANKIGDPSKGSQLAGVAGVAAGINPVGIVKSFANEGAKAGLKEAGKSAATGAGAVYGAEGLGGIASSLTNVALEKLGKDKLSDSEQEAMKGLAAPVSAGSAGKLYEHAIASKNKGKSAFDVAKEVTASGNAEKRIKQVEADAPPERVVDEHAIAKNLVKQGATEEEALATAKKATQGAYGDISKSKTREVDHRIVDSVKNTVDESLSGTEPTAEAKQPIDLISKAVRSFDSVKALLDTPEADATPEAKMAQMHDTVDNISNELKSTVPSIDKLRYDDDFNKWLKGHNIASLPEADRTSLASKYFIKNAIDKYYENHVEPVKSELMQTPSGITDGEGFAQHVAESAKYFADPGDTSGIGNKMYKEVVALDAMGRLNTVDGVYSLMNSIEHNSAFSDNPGAKGEMKKAIAAWLPEEVQNKIAQFKEAYAPFGTEMKGNAPLYKLATYDPTTTTNAKSSAKILDFDSAPERFNTMLTLAKESPDVAYSALHGMNVKLNEAYETKGFKGMQEVIRDSAERMDALADTLPDNHPAKTAFNMMQGLLKVTRDADTISKQVDESRKIAENRNALVSDVEHYTSDLAHYGQYAVDSYTSLLAMMAQDPGMLAALKAQPIGSSVPLTHDVARSLLESTPVNPDLTKQRSMLKALSVVQGTDSVIPDLIRQGISSEVAKFNEDGSLDHKGTIENLRGKGDRVRTYVRNLHTLLDTTDGLNPEQVASSKKYLDSVSDALEVADNDIVNRVFQRVYSPAEKTNTQGDIKQASGASVKKAAWSLGRGNSSEYTLWSTVADVIAHNFHGKDAIDTAILNKLDDPEFVKSVSKLKEGYSKQRAADVRAQAEKDFSERENSIHPGLIDNLKAVYHAVFPGGSVATSFLDKAKAFGSWYTKSTSSILPYYKEKQRLQHRFDQNFTQPENNEPGEEDENLKIMMNWKG